MITDDLVARVLDALEQLHDVRARNQVRRLRRVLEELRDNHGQARHPRYRLGAKRDETVGF